MLWRGRLSFRVYNPAKPIKYGIKSYVLADSTTGYCWNLLPYCGTHCTIPDTVTTLLGRLVGYGHKLYMDNFYNSVNLTHTLLDLKTAVCGTLRTNRGEPAEFKTLKLTKGETTARHDDNVMVLCWQDKRLVKMISTCHQEEKRVVNVRQRGQRELVPIEKPTCIIDYNANMNGVDRIDQQIQYYPFVRKTIKWHKKFSTYLMELCFHNSFILFSQQNPNSKIKTLYQFIRCVCYEWTSPTRPVSPPSSPNSSLPSSPLSSPSSPPLSSPASSPASTNLATPRATPLDPDMRLDRNPANHILIPIVGKGKTRHPTRKCRVCLRNNKRSETRYFCENCKVPLHKGQCYSLYHSAKSYS